jgi:ribonuclease PH
MNVVMTDKGEFVEVQGTGEENPFSRKQLEELLSLAETGIRQLIQIQKNVLLDDGHRIGGNGEEIYAYKSQENYYSEQ